MTWSHLFFGVLFVAAFESGCARYRPLPLTSTPVTDRLQVPTDEVIKLKASEIQHPLLRPLPIDGRDGLSPDEAAVVAVVANPQLIAVRDQRGLAAAQLLQARILPNPQLSANLGVPAAGSTTGTVNAFGFGLDWNVRALLVRTALIDAAKRQAESIDLEIAWQEWQVAQAARLQVFRVFFLEQQMAVARSEVEAFQRSLDLVRKALAAGYMTVMDLASARAALQRSQVLLLAVDQQLVLEKLALNRALGFPPDRKVALQANIEVPVITDLTDLPRIMNGLESRRLDLVAFRLGYESQEARLRAAVRGRFPAINLSLAQARDTGNVVTAGSGLSIGLPFFDRNQGAIAFESATRQQLFDEYTSRLFDARAVAAQILANARSLRDQIQAGEQAVQSLQELVETYRVALLEGSADVLLYYNARNELMAKQLDVVRLKQDLADQSVALEIAAGAPLSSLGKRLTK